ncbi:HEAT repeat-containing protein [Candidatus Electrothrix laxa]
MIDQELAEMFLREYDDIQKSRKTGRQAIQYVDTLVNNEPQKALELLAIIIDCCKSNDELAHVAAGPLENLFVYHGYEIIDKIKEKADHSEKFQLALSGIWLDEDEDAIFFQWLELMKRYKLVGDNPRQKL